MFTLGYLINEVCGVIHQNLLKKEHPEEKNDASVEELKKQKENEDESIMTELQDTYIKLGRAMKERAAVEQQVMEVKGALKESKKARKNLQFINQTLLEKTKELQEVCKETEKAQDTVRTEEDSDESERSDSTYVVIQDEPDESESIAMTHIIIKDASDESDSSDEIPVTTQNNSAQIVYLTSDPDRAEFLMTTIIELQQNLDKIEKDTKKVEAENRVLAAWVEILKDSFSQDTHLNDLHLQNQELVEEIEELKESYKITEKAHNQAVAEMEELNISLAQAQRVHEETVAQNQDLLKRLKLKHQHRTSSMNDSMIARTSQSGRDVSRLN